MAFFGYNGSSPNASSSTTKCGAGGLFNPGAGTWQLDSVYVYSDGASSGTRMVVYTNATDALNGATLVEDLGSQVLANGANTVNSPTNPLLVDGTYVFVVFYTDSGANFLRFTALGGDWTARWLGDANVDDTVAPESPAEAEWSSSAFALNAGLNYSEVATPASSGAGVNRGLTKVPTTHSAVVGAMRRVGNLFVPDHRIIRPRFVPGFAF